MPLFLRLPAAVVSLWPATPAVAFTVPDSTASGAFNSTASATLPNVNRLENAIAAAGSSFYGVVTLEGPAQTLAGQLSEVTDMYDSGSDSDYEPTGDALTELLQADLEYMSVMETDMAEGFMPDVTSSSSSSSSSMAGMDMQSGAGRRMLAN